MTITKVIRDLIEDESYSEVVSSVGNTTPTLINSIVISDSNWANTNNTYARPSDNIKIFGLNFKDNVKVKLIRKNAITNTITADNEVFGKISTQTDASNITLEDSSYIKASIPSSLNTGIYSIFVINEEGTNTFNLQNDLKVKNKSNSGITGGGSFANAYNIYGTPQTGALNSAFFRLNFENSTMTGWANLNTIQSINFGKAASDYENMYFFKGIDDLNIWKPAATMDTYTSTVTTRINFSTSVVVDKTLNTLHNQFLFATISNRNQQKIYSIAGCAPNGTGSRSNVSRFETSSETITNNLTTTAYNIAAASSSSNDNYGWIYGGWSNIQASGIWYSTTPVNDNYYGVSYTSRIDFSSETNQLLTRGNLITEQHYMVAGGNQDYGFTGGGMLRHQRVASPNGWSYVSRLPFQKITYASDTNAFTSVPTGFSSGFSQAFVDQNNDALYFKHHSVINDTVTYTSGLLDDPTSYYTAVNSNINLYRLTFSNSTLASGFYELVNNRLGASTEGYF